MKGLNNLIFGQFNTDLKTDFSIENVYIDRLIWICPFDRSQNEMFNQARFENKLSSVRIPKNF